ncbi:MAG TPA: FGGY family carbohydrate kinase [Polyangiaceae bacterium]|nr:FGGY family carbohydrate kinase [Polyangiaceae bacterium]
MTAGDLVLSVDCSTTACKAIVWDAAGGEVASGRQGFPLLNPVPDGYEQDAGDWSSALFAAIGEAVRQLTPERRRAIRALGLTHQRETFVLTDRGGQPLLPAVVWMDSRCRRHVELAQARLDPDEIHRISGKPVCTTPSLYKLMFLLAEHPEVARQAPMVLDVHGYLAFALTGRFATSLASADPTGLIDMQARDWSPELLELAGIGRAQLAELFAPGAVFGVLQPDAATRCDLPPGLPVVAGAGDGQAAGLGAGISGPGRAYLNLGTAIVSGVLSRTYTTDRAFRTMYGALPDSYFLETDLKGGTFTLGWLVETLLERDGSELARLEQQARALPPGAGGLLLLPYFNAVMNPYWDDDASGAILGLDGSHGPAHLLRAALEGIALEQRLHSRAVEAASGVPIDELVVMGGGSESDLFCQIVADVLDRRIVRARSAQATSLGAAILAASAAGLHPDIAAATRAMTADGDAFEPGPHREIYDRLFNEAYVGLYPALKNTMHALKRLRV